MQHIDDYQNRDIDWFILINTTPVHVASGGGVIPRIIQKSMENNNNILKEINSLPNIFTSDEILVQPELIQQIINIKHLDAETILSACHIPIAHNNSISTYIRSVYCTSFIKFARKGFFSFDKTDINIPNNDKYHLVASPPCLKINKTIVDKLPKISCPQWNKQSLSNIELIKIIDSAL